MGACFLNEFDQIIKTNHVVFREATTEDASFVYTLRRFDSRKMLTDIPEGVVHQENYLKNMKEIPRLFSTQRYLIVEDGITQAPVGTVRLTELTDPSRMGWESLIIKEGSRPQVAIDVIVSVYKICFEELSRPLLGPWKILKTNSHMMRMHAIMGFAKPVGENDSFYWYAVTSPDYRLKISTWTNRGFGVLTNNSQLFMNRGSGENRR